MIARRKRDAASKAAKEDPFDKVMGEADALREAAIEAVPREPQPVAEDLLQNILRQAKARPLMALAIAAAVGFFIASITSR